MKISRSLRPKGRDDGSITILILGCVLVVVVMIMALTAATSAFLAQRTLQSDCDGAAEWAASAVDPHRIFDGQAANSDRLPLQVDGAREAVDEYHRRFYRKDPTLTMAPTVASDTLSVRCRRVVKITFGTFFGKGGGVERTAISSINSPVSESA
ncbi:MAG TPA: pilus assembly protein TadG-related protein [Mycobacteriales bacterium]|jgi:hypothetical protein|nr:pilus assembly protein TadG-related protein [Mycobacteriales bacterium]